MQQPANTLRRTVVLWILALAWVASQSGWVLKEWLGQAGPAMRIIFALNTVFHPVLFVIAWKRLLSQRIIDFACLLFAAVICAVCMALRLYAPVYGASIDLEPLYLWIPIIYVFVFILTDYRTGLKISVAILALFVVVSMPYLVGSPREHTLFTLTLHIVSAALIAAFYFFSSYQHRFQIAQLTMDELARMANTDELTGLANRRRMAEAIESELRRFARYGHPFSVILLDIDSFKAINDKFGHGIGDQALAALARRSSEALRDVDIMGRWGGEEFVIVLPETAYEQGLQRAEELRHHIATAPSIDAPPVTVSCGVTTVRGNDSVDSLIRRADTALYAAKDSGRNCVKGISPGQPEDTEASETHVDEVIG